MPQKSSVVDHQKTSIGSTLDDGSNFVGFYEQASSLKLEQIIKYISRYL